MTTRETVQGYFSKLKQHEDWTSVLAEDVQFTTQTSPVQEVQGRAEFLSATKDFYSMIKSFEVKALLVEGDRACALTRYELQPADRAPFSSEVAEIFSVRDGTISSFDVYFDAIPYSKE